MTKYHSLIFREFKVCQKQYIIKSVLLFAFFAFIIGTNYLFIPLFQGEAEKDKLIKAFAETFSMLIIFWSTIFFAADSTFKSDLKSGWNNYSYALPLKASTRAAVKLMHFFITFGITALLGMVCVFVVNLISGTIFQIGYVVLQFIFLDLLLLSKIITDYFTLRARTIDEYKKMNEKGNLICIAFMFCIAVIILKCIGLDFTALLNSETSGLLKLNMKLDIVSTLTGGMLLWAIPLTLALGAAYYAVIYHCLQYAYSGGVRIKKANDKAEEAANLTTPHSEPVGFLYKELRQNTQSICAVTVLPFVILVFLTICLFIVSLDESNHLKGGIIRVLTSDMLRLAALALGYSSAGGLLLSVFHGDDKKLWAYFVASTPTGVNKFLYAKYTLSFAMCGLYFASSYFAETLVATIRWFAFGEEIGSFTGIFIMAFFALLLQNSFTIPMMLRFGEKRGSIINLIIILALVIAVILALSFIPAGIKDKVFTWLAGFMTNEHGDLTMLLLGMFPAVSVGAYYLSYKVSCRIFMKGVNEYDK